VVALTQQVGEMCRARAVREIIHVVDRGPLGDRGCARPPPCCQLALQPQGRAATVDDAAAAAAAAATVAAADDWRGQARTDASTYCKQLPRSSIHGRSSFVTVERTFFAWTPEIAL
jgi:hypothetical protein